MDIPISSDLNWPLRLDGKVRLPDSLIDEGLNARVISSSLALCISDLIYLRLPLIVCLCSSYIDPRAQSTDWT